MSIRTVVEFNHDYLSELHRRGEISEKLYRTILDSNGKQDPLRPVIGVRILGQRHHSETLTLKVE